MWIDTTINATYKKSTFALALPKINIFDKADVNEINETILLDNGLPILEIQGKKLNYEDITNGY